MQALSRFAVLLLVALGIARAQPMPEAELRKIPLDQALVLDPAVGWSQIHTSEKGHTWAASLDVELGHMRATVGERGKHHRWHRILANRVEPERYPIAVVTYRATGLLAAEQPLLTASVPLLRNLDAIADGKTHEAVVDLRELGAELAIASVVVSPCCQGPEPAVFELLGLRFEADGKLPPAGAARATENRFRVIDRKGKPVEGVTVSIDADLLNGARSAVTGTDGKVTIQAAATPGPGRIVRIAKEGMAPAEIGSWLTEDLPTKLMILPGTRYGGIVRNEEGKPVENVSVSLGGYSASESPNGRQWQTTVVTDTDGRWLSPVLPDEPTILAPTLRHPDYCKERSGAVSITDLRQGKAEMLIRRGATVRGLVVGPDGQPVERASVRFSTAATWNRRAELETDARGRFSVGALPPGKRAFLVQHAGFAPALVELDLGPDAVETTIRLEPPNEILGRVQDMDGSPLPGVRISIENWRGNRQLAWRGRTGPDGEFRWSDGPADTVHMRFSGPKGYMTLRDYPVKAAAGGTIVLMPPVLRISGTVTDGTTGKPVGDCSVSCNFLPPKHLRGKGTPPSWVFDMPNGAKRTKSDGRYELTIGMSGFGWATVLQAMAPGYRRGQSREFHLEGTDQTCDLILQAGTEIKGVVLLPDGGPVAGTALYLLKPHQSLTLQNGAIVGPTTDNTVTVGEDGRFRLTATTDTWLLAAIGASGYVEIDSDSFTSPGKLVLQPWGRVEGTCQFDGKPVPNCRIRMQPDFSRFRPGKPRVGRSFWTVTDASGGFAMPRVPPGMVTLGATMGQPREGFIPPFRDRVAVVPPGKTIRLDFGGTGRPVIGRLSLAEGMAGTVVWEKVSIGIIPDVKLKSPKRPAGWADLSRQAQAQRMQSKEGKAYIAALTNYQQAMQQAFCATGLPLCNSTLAPDARFRVPDLPSGKYRLAARAQVAGAGKEGSKTSVTVKLTHAFTVPKVPGGRSEEPLDLGTLVLRVKK